MEVGQGKPPDRLATWLSLAEKLREKAATGDPYKLYFGDLAALASALRDAIKTRDALVSALRRLADEHEAAIASEGFDREHCDCPALTEAWKAIAEAHNDTAS